MGHYGAWHPSCCCGRPGSALEAAELIPIPSVRSWMGHGVVEVGVRKCRGAAAGPGWPLNARVAAGGSGCPSGLFSHACTAQGPPVVAAAVAAAAAAAFAAHATTPGQPTLNECAGQVPGRAQAQAGMQRCVNQAAHTRVHMCMGCCSSIFNTYPAKLWKYKACVPYIGIGQSYVCPCTWAGFKEESDRHHNEDRSRTREVIKEGCGGFRSTCLR
eukprot:410447-Pelagomonas_calceolata.AAC.2